MKYPTIEVIKQLELLQSSDIETIFNIVVKCIDYIYDDTQLYYASESTTEELNTFLGSLKTEQFVKLENLSKIHFSV